MRGSNGESRGKLNTFQLLIFVVFVRGLTDYKPFSSGYLHRLFKTNIVLTYCAGNFLGANACLRLFEL